MSHPYGEFELEQVEIKGGFVVRDVVAYGVVEFPAKGERPAQQCAYLRIAAVNRTTGQLEEIDFVVPNDGALGVFMPALLCAIASVDDPSLGCEHN